MQAVWRSDYNLIGNQPGKKWKLTGQPAFKELTYAMDRWDREVGSQKIKQ